MQAAKQEGPEGVAEETKKVAELLSSLPQFQGLGNGSATPSREVQDKEGEEEGEVQGGKEAEGSEGSGSSGAVQKLKEEIEDLKKAHETDIQNMIMKMSAKEVELAQLRDEKKALQAKVLLHGAVGVCWSLQ